MTATRPGTPPGSPAAAADRQEIRFLEAPDGTRLAWAVHGAGPRLVNVCCWLSHLQFDWQSPVWRHFLEDLGAFTTLVRYDERGSGLSDWEIDDYSIDARVGDLETVTAQLPDEKVALLALSQGGPVAIEYAVRHPERVSHLILYGAYARGGLAGNPSPERVAEIETLISLTKIGWARPNPVFRRVFTNMFIPDATDEQVAWFDDLQRMSTSTENAAWARRQRALVDVTHLLPHVRVPTLVLHARGDEAVSFRNGVEIATAIPGARLVPLESRNHILLASEPAWTQLVAEVRAFLGVDDRAPEAAAGLSEREEEVLRLAADGLDNEEIARALTLSVRTVERHLSNVYAKIGVSGKAARAAAVARFVRSR